MKEHRSDLILSVLVAIGAVATAACDDGGTDPVAAAGAGGAGGGGAPSTGGAPPGGKTAGATLVPDATGWVDIAAPGNSVGVQGSWYPYGDQYGADKKCLTPGNHMPAECSRIDSPDPAVMKFENVGGKMCTKGSVAKVLNGADGMPDWSNMWGAGIGLDLNLPAGGTGAKMPYDAVAKGVTGIGFNITTPPKALRVELPIPATEGHVDGSDYWGAGTSFPPSPVVAGWNEFKWAAVTGPKGAIAFDPTKILSVQFHVPANKDDWTAFDYCISDLTFLTQ